MQPIGTSLENAPSGIFNFLGYGVLGVLKWTLLVDTNVHMMEPTAVLGDYQSKLWLTNADQVKFPRLGNNC